MKFQGEHYFQAPRARVWEAILDHQVLVASFPGLKRLGVIGEHEYEGALEVKIGPVQGDFQGTLKLTDLKPPTSYRLRLSGMGGAGFADGEGMLVLEESGGGTRLHYDVDVKLGGQVGGIEVRRLDSSAKIMARQTFEGIERQFTPGAQVRLKTQQELEAPAPVPAAPEEAPQPAVPAAEEEPFRQPKPPAATPVPPEAAAPPPRPELANALANAEPLLRALEPPTEAAPAEVATPPPPPAAESDRPSPSDADSAPASVPAAGGQGAAASRRSAAASRQWPWSRIDLEGARAAIGKLITAERKPWIITGLLLVYTVAVILLTRACSGS